MSQITFINVSGHDINPNFCTDSDCEECILEDQTDDGETYLLEDDGTCDFEVPPTDRPHIPTTEGMDNPLYDGFEVFSNPADVRELIESEQFKRLPFMVQIALIDKIKEYDFNNVYIQKVINNNGEFIYYIKTIHFAPVSFAQFLQYWFLPNKDYFNPKLPMRTDVKGNKVVQYVNTAVSAYESRHNRTRAMNVRHIIPEEEAMKYSESQIRIIRV